MASLACGLAPDVWFLLGARLWQGASAALIVPQVLATFHATLQGARLHRAQSLYGAAAGLAIAVGQLAGGLLVTVNIAGTTWRPIFWVNVPIGLATLIAIPRVVPPTRSEHPATIDIRGTLLFAATLVALLVPLAEGQTEGWPRGPGSSSRARPSSGLSPSFSSVASRAAAESRCCRRPC